MGALEDDIDDLQRRVSNLERILRAELSKQERADDKRQTAILNELSKEGAKK